MNKVTCFAAVDGRLFNKAEECTAHEATLVDAASIDAFIESRFKDVTKTRAVNLRGELVAYELSKIKRAHAPVVTEPVSDEPATNDAQASDGAGEPAAPAT